MHKLAISVPKLSPWPALWHWHPISFARQHRGFYRDFSGQRSLSSLFYIMCFFLLAPVASGCTQHLGHSVMYPFHWGVKQPVILTLHWFSANVRWLPRKFHQQQSEGNFPACLKHTPEGSFLLASPGMHHLSKLLCQPQCHSHTTSNESWISAL